MTLDSAGCEHWACGTDECPVLAAPEPGFCGDEQATEPVYDERGCIVGYECVNPTCPDYQMPECADGQELVAVEDSAGCVHHECHIIECPPIAAPDPEMCGGAEPQPVWENGCVFGYTCPDECPVIAQPEPGFCGDEQGLEPVYDERGCLIAYECVDPICPDVQIPECAAGEEVVAIEDSAGCVHYECQADATSFACGDALTCNLDTEYCFIEYPGQPGPVSYSCQPLPDACADAVSCECLTEVFGECAEDAAGGISVSVFYP